MLSKRSAILVFATLFFLTQAVLMLPAIGAFRYLLSCRRRPPREVVP